MSDAYIIVDGVRLKVIAFLDIMGEPISGPPHEVATVVAQHEADTKPEGTPQRFQYIDTSNGGLVRRAAQ
jgi:hypothetical protein